MISLLFAGKYGDLNKVVLCSARGGGKYDYKECGPVPTK